LAGGGAMASTRKMAERCGGGELELVARDVEKESS
jgi:hypothetical protein